MGIAVERPDVGILARPTVLWIYKQVVTIAQSNHPRLSFHPAGFPKENEPWDYNRAPVP
jgi:hypothetical protein